MNTSQRAKHLQKVSSLTLSDISDTSFDTSHLLCSRNPDMATLSVDLSVLTGTAKLPQTVLEGIWNKASELLKTDNAIVSAPGLGAGAKYVMSYSGTKPHLVTLKKGGSVCCDADCSNWKGLGICSHVVAVAEACGILAQFITNSRRQRKFPIYPSWQSQPYLKVVVGKEGRSQGHGRQVFRSKLGLEIQTWIRPPIYHPPHKLLGCLHPST